jgi:hypothetical protein
MNIKKYLACYLCVLYCGLVVVHSVSAQHIIHIDSRKLEARDIGWSGIAEIQANFVQNDNDIFQSYNNLQIAYRTERTTWLSLSHLNFTLLNGNSLIGDMYQHFRFTASCI